MDRPTSQPDAQRTANWAKSKFQRALAVTRPQRDEVPPFEARPNCLGRLVELH